MQDMISSDWTDNEKNMYLFEVMRSRETSSMFFIEWAASVNWYLKRRLADQCVVGWWLFRFCLCTHQICRWNKVYSRLCIERCMHFLRCIMLQVAFLLFCQLLLSTVLKRFRLKRGSNTIAFTTRFSFAYCEPFSSPEAALLLVSTKNRNL